MILIVTLLPDTRTSPQSRLCTLQRFPNTIFPVSEARRSDPIGDENRKRTHFFRIVSFSFANVFQILRWSMSRASQQDRQPRTSTALAVFFPPSFS